MEKKRRKIWKRIILSVLGIAALLFIGLLALIYIPSPKFESYSYEPVVPEYWPTSGFEVSVPEKQGMDSTRLVEMLEYVQEQNNSDPEVMIDSITVIKDGYIVADGYFNPLYQPDTLHVMHSCTKSVMSALIGIAIDQGYIEGVDVPIVEFFKEENYTIQDPRMELVTLKDLLTMQTGIRSRDSFVYGYSGLYEAFATDDWVEYTLGLPMDKNPGERYDYSNLSSFMLSAIITKTTGMDTRTFADENLFGPLGIGEIYWETSPKGISVGFARMWMKPHDMAKFGLLYLQKGNWDGRQIISEQWIEESLEPHAYPKNYVDVLDENGEKDTQASQENWGSLKFMRPFTDGYGYQWWLAKDGSYNALGTSGQYIMVIPQHNLVVSVTNSSPGMGIFLPKTLLDEYIIPSISTELSNEGNSENLERLASFATPPEVIESEIPVPNLPAIALEISSKHYQLEPNNWNLNNIVLEFDSELEHATFSYTAKVHDEATFEIGLDGLFRYTDTPIGRFAAKGQWLEGDVFVVDYQLIGYSAPVHYEITFTGDQIDIVETSLTGTHIYTGTVK